ncbi:uncharacterized protein SPSK_04344 [Sporothrix schenckii 1099-18]|uniref:Uncharacterized protein n=1 Tax=Sporothrix schenckii 1099-18 TaxID=1397361 RepID=A0A0F2M3Y8_SPOSC|nr:uncharacterized protein SPSK_04344 [Sporothrix schenckii 1099-18]KJR83480.1 hypothetical protein SPSK_04344 [Sporothrix schenckii 1099-18]
MDTVLAEHCVSPKLYSRRDWYKWVEMVRDTAASYWTYWDPLYRKPKERRLQAPRACQRGPHPGSLRTPLGPRHPQETSPTGRPTATPATLDRGELPEFSRYWTERELYTAYDNKQSVVRSLIHRSVAPHIADRLDDLPDDSIAGWLAFLYKHYGENKEEAMLLAEKEYQAVLGKFIARTPKEWFTSWRNALHECGRLNLPCTISGSWLRDLYVVLIPHFADIAIETRRAYNSKDPDEYDVRRASHLESEVLQATTWLERSRSLYSGRVVKGFGCTASLDPADDGAIQGAANKGLPAQNTDEQPPPYAQKTTYKKRPRTNTRGGIHRPVKRQQGDPGEKKCEGCLKTGHTWEQCWGLFPEKAPKGVHTSRLRHVVAVAEAVMFSKPDLAQRVTDKRKHL